MLAALGSYDAAVALPVSSGGIGLAMRYFGSGDGFNTSQLGFGYGRRLGENAAIGAQINYNTLHVPGYGSAGAVNFELGTRWRVRDKWHLGVHLYNPVGGRFGKDNTEKLASVYTLGLGYEASPQCLLSAVLAKEEDRPVNVNLGIEYLFAGQFVAKAGIASATGNWCVGVGVKWASFRVDAVAGWHPQLGITPALLIAFDLKEKKEAVQP
jgi:hypothetical protein